MAPCVWWDVCLVLVTCPGVVGGAGDKMRCGVAHWLAGRERGMSAGGRNRAVGLLSRLGQRLEPAPRGINRESPAQVIDRSAAALPGVWCTSVGVTSWEQTASRGNLRQRWLQR